MSRAIALEKQISNATTQYTGSILVATDSLINFLQLVSALCGFKFPRIFRCSFAPVHRPARIRAMFSLVLPRAVCALVVRFFWRFLLLQHHGHDWSCQRKVRGTDNEFCDSPPDTPFYPARPMCGSQWIVEKIVEIVFSIGICVSIRLSTPGGGRRTSSSRSRKVGGMESGSICVRK